MHDNKSIPAEQSETAKHLITRRKMLKQAGAAGIAMTALYVAPSFSSVGPRPAYASATGSTPCDDLCTESGRRPRYLTLEYTGDSGDGTNSASTTPGVDAGKKPVIDGWMNNQSPVRIKWVTENAPGTVFQTYDIPVVGGRFTLDYNDSDHGHDHIDASVRLIICTPTDPTVLQDIIFHSSCSAPLAIGDSFGSVELVNYIDENGRVNCDPADDATPTPEPEEGDCPTHGKKIQTLTLLYQGQDETNSSHTQDSNKVEINDHNGGPTGATVYIEVCDALTNPSNIWFAGNVGLNGTPFVATAGGGTSEMTNETFVKVYASNGGNLLQEIEFHTSCSQPLVVGNEFGSITINGLGLV